MKPIHTSTSVLAMLLILSMVMLFGCGGGSGDTTSNPPSAPTGVAATAGDGQVTISWSPADGATTYNIYWNTSGSVTTSDSAVIGAPSPYVHTNLTNGTTYYYVVTAINNDGESDLSSEVQATPEAIQTPPSAPTNVQATAGDGQATISWSPVAGATSYNIYWNTTGSVTTSDNAIIGALSPYVHLNLTNGAGYYYIVTAINAEGESGASVEVSAMPRVLFSDMLQKISAGDAQASDYFGWSVSISGDYAIVGAHYEDGGTGDTLLDAGAAYIFHRTGPNTWDAGTKIDAPDAQENDHFGWSVSISGGYAIVGAPHEDDGGTDAGAAYMFHRTGPNIWDSGTKIVAPDAGGGDRFGVSVSISGDYAIVGAGDEDGVSGDPLFNSGAAYIFHRTGPNTWDAGTKIVASDAQISDGFGVSVSISGDYAIVGAPYEDGGSNNTDFNSGAGYIFRRTGQNIWDSGTKIVAPDAQVWDIFGYSVSISGDYAIVGAVYESDGGMSAGAAYIFQRTGPTAWDGGTKILAPDADASDHFGCSVSISGDYAIVGSINEDGVSGNPDFNSGAAYIFHRTGQNIWDSGTKRVAPDAGGGDRFGLSVSISGDSAIVGADLEDGGAGDPYTDAGAAYIY